MKKKISRRKNFPFRDRVENGRWGGCAVVRGRRLGLDASAGDQRCDKRCFTASKKSRLKPAGGGKSDPWRDTLTKGNVQRTVKQSKNVRSQRKGSPAFRER
jgi:hypothetical protein